MTNTRSCRPIHIVACCGLSLGLAAGSLAQVGQQPGQRPDQPAPGQPGFVMPVPNRGQQPETKPTEPQSPPAQQQPVQQGNAADPEQPAYLVGAFVIRYALDHPSLPAIDDLMKKEITLGKTDAGFVAPGGGVPTVTTTIEDVSLEPAQKWSSRALYLVEKAILEEMNAEGVIGVTVTPIDTEFAPPGAGDPQWGKDLRKPGQSAVTLLVKVGLVTEMRTIAFGDRIPFEDRINAPQHKHILDNSPVKVFQPDDPERNDVLRKDELDDYVFRLNRHPGRRVDLAIAAAEAQGGVALDYLVNENKPWLAYFQVSNTGTKNTNEWRERFGFTHNQLTNHDDILNLDFVTSGFDSSSNAFVGSYERPLYGDRIRGRVYANWNNFVASDVGIDLGSGANQQFKGDGYAFGGELIANVFQHRELFIDAFAGVRFQHVHVNNELVGISGSDDFFLPDLGARLERNTDTSATNASVTIEFNLPDVAGTSATEIDKLGRLDVDRSWETLQWDISHSFYLDPLFFGSRWSDTSPSGHATLAHELALSVRGQYAFDNRLIPNFEQVLGGLYTVRGYPESVVAGDTVIVGSAEYRLHIPQAFGYDPNPGTLFGQTFRWKPQAPYGHADWDLIAKGFVDAGRVLQSHKKSYESNDTLIGAGFGLEFLYKRNLSIRADWGWALDTVTTTEQTVTSGSNRFHFVATILF